MVVLQVWTSETLETSETLDFPSGKHVEKNDLKLKNLKHHSSYLYNILHIFDMMENNKCDHILVNEFY